MTIKRFKEMILQIFTLMVNKYLLKNIRNRSVFCFSFHCAINVKDLILQRGLIRLDALSLSLQVSLSD